VPVRLYACMAVHVTSIVERSSVNITKSTPTKKQQNKLTELKTGKTKKKYHINDMRKNNWTPSFSPRLEDVSTRLQSSWLTQTLTVKFC